MAAVDPIVNAQLCKLFPALTPKQAQNLSHYALGSNYDRVSELTHSTSAGAKKSLESIQKYFNVNKLIDLKIEFWAVYFTHQIRLKYNWIDPYINKALVVDDVSTLHPLFPELSHEPLTIVILHYLEYPIKDISTFTGLSLSHVERILLGAMAALSVQSEQSLKMTITWRFMNDLC